MKWNFLKTCSLVLILAILINLLPMQVLGADMRLALQDSLPSTGTAQSEAGDAEIVGEAVEKRTQFSKEYILSNGMHMAVVYPEAVHYDDDGQWKDIDNTLKSVGSGATGTYTNRAGAWKAIFPQQLNKNKQVSIEKDGYTVSFAMAGELRTSNIPVLQNEFLSAGVLDAGAVQDTALSVVAAQNVAAQIQDLDYTAMKESAEHPEVIRDKIKSRLKYSNVFNNTDIIYDMNSYQVKESIVIHNYNAAVRGYQYNLNTDGLVPILNSDNSIDLVDTATNEVVMSMPAPFMIDAAGEISTEVQVSLAPKGGQYILTYEMPMEWLADTERQWPVVLDPAVTVSPEDGNVVGKTITENSSQNTDIGELLVGSTALYGKIRTFLQFTTLPEISSADVIVHAQTNLYKNAGTTDNSVIEVHKVQNIWDSETITWANQPGFDEAIEDYAHVDVTGEYYWNVTDIVRGWYGGLNTGMVFKATNAVEGGDTDNWKQFYLGDSIGNTTDAHPCLIIIIKNVNGLEDYWDYTAHGAGRAGTGYINNYSGNLVWVREDLGFGGNRMPVSISHIYNSNDKQSNKFGLGLGWRTNYNQTVEQWSEDSSYYIWEDGDGTKHYFKHDSGSNYIDEDGLGLTLTVTSTGTSIQDDYGNTSYFDSHGRLINQENNQQTKSSIGITYTTSNGYLISQITDGVGRKYNFTYNSSGLLSKITYTGKGNSESSSVTYSYSGSSLTSITDKDGKSSVFSYTTDNLLSGVQDVDGYRLAYTYTAGSPKRVASVSEYQGTGTGTPGGSLTISYGQNQTKFTDHNGNVQITQFNDWGNTLSIQDGEGKAQYAQYALNDYSDAPNGTAKGNQMRLASKMQNTVVNLLSDSSFESGNTWTSMHPNVIAAVTSDHAYSGNNSLKVTSTASTITGARENALDISLGQTVSYSAYIKTESDTTVYLAIDTLYGTILESSDPVGPGSDWTRVEMVYTHYDDEFPIYPQLLCEGAGTFYLDCVQIEMESTASRYNLLENNDSWGGSSLDNCWTRSSTMTSSDNITTLSSSAYEKLDNTVFAITGDPSAEKYVSQTITQSGTAGDTYVLTGWGIGDATPENAYDTNARAFGLKVILNNTDGTKTESFAPFNSDLPADGNWQYTATGVVAEKAYSSITVQAVYSYHCNTVYFDGIQLFQERFGYQYDYNTAGYVEQVTDLQGGITSYSYNEETNDLTSVTQPDASVTTYGYDTKHNVTSTATEANVQYSLAYDDYGNTTSVTIINGNSKITSTSTYSDDGNRLVSTTDALGKTTTYGYNENTNVLEWVQYPEDTAATRTNYTYDAMYRLATAAATTDTGSALTASYTYTNDMLTQIQTGSTTYSFTYGAFAQRSSIKIGSRTLASYTYSDDQNRYLTQLDYGNGDYVQYTYDDQGRVIRERFEDGKSISYSYDSTGALESVYDSSTYRNTKYSYDLSGRLNKYTESDTGRSVAYTYDELSNVTQLVETINGTKHTISYSYDSDNRINQVTNGRTDEDISYDAYGRLSRRMVYDVESREYTDGITNVITYDYTYTTGTDTTVQSNYLKALTYETPWISGSVNYSYDNNGNISQYVSAWDGGSSAIGYVYDSANQLIRENNSGMGSTWVWTYDNAGNILTSKKYSYTTAADLSGLTPLESHTYTYGDADWGDLLTAYDGTAITYDTIGNPLTDGTWTYTWEHGRQLKSMSNGSTTWNYTYDASGMRKSRTNGSATYTYVYNGGQLTQMTKGNDTLYFTYGSTGPVSVTWNGTTYYYLTNAQGDVIGIMEHTGDLAVEYRYNAWGEVTYSGYEPELAQLNPLRYRGYVYDSETGLYYLQSRYYNPKLGRFLNADEFLSTGEDILGNNMFGYCLNNPVNILDPTGAAGIYLSDYLLYTLGGALSSFVLSITSSIASIKTAIATSIIPVVCIAAITVGVAALTVAVYKVRSLSYSAQRAIAAVKAQILAKKLQQSDLKGYTVYVISRRGTTDVVYVGMTRNYSSRQYAHQIKSGARFPSGKYTMLPIATNLSKSQARALEQTLICAYGIDTLCNLINSISPSKWGYFIQEFNQMATLLESFIDPE